MRNRPSHPYEWHGFMGDRTRRRRGYRGLSIASSRCEWQLPCPKNGRFSIIAFFTSVPKLILATPHAIARCIDSSGTPAPRGARAPSRRRRRECGRADRSRGAPRRDRTRVPFPRRRRARRASSSRWRLGTRPARASFVILSASDQVSEFFINFTSLLSKSCAR
jgi:hypothetical protein